MGNDVVHDFGTSVKIPNIVEVARDLRLHETAKAFEASFLAEMLKFAGVAEQRESFGGGAGETAFASFLTEQYANKFADNGGIGLAENIYQSLKKLDVK